VVGTGTLGWTVSSITLKLRAELGAHMNCVSRVYSIALRQTTPALHRQDWTVTPIRVRSVRRIGPTHSAALSRHAVTTTHRCRHTLHNLPSPAAAPRTIWLPGLCANLTSRPDPPIVLGHTDLPPAMAAVGPSNGGTVFGLGRTVHI
jgi:hypothetical protein